MYDVEGSAFIAGCGNELLWRLDVATQRMRYIL
jgi:hypothetical protein